MASSLLLACLACRPLLWLNGAGDTVTNNKGANRFASARSDDEQPGKRQQDGPVRLRGIGFGDRLLVASREGLPLAFLERIKERAKASSLQPFDDRTRTGERMKVSRPPDIDLRGMGAQQAEIPVRGTPLGARR